MTPHAATQELADDLQQACIEGQIRMIEAQMAAEEAKPGFTIGAAAYIYRYLLEHNDGRRPGELLVDVAKEAGYVPPNGDRAFGYVFRRLSDEGLIRQVGWTVRRKGHGSGGGRIWEAV